ncbi:hypothetical protein KQX54_012809 [Cotesia glomerata]|uniref:Uncharacterized protein n=1 Tax=Cotesia glomerata TaxID=32391 RepID=A0AAV7IBL6_COTGL|nr:hypothetical protein KQX54_012809 [Cotesia glomerata]
MGGNTLAENICNYYSKRILSSVCYYRKYYYALMYCDGTFTDDNNDAVCHHDYDNSVPKSTSLQHVDQDSASSESNPIPVTQSLAGLESDKVNPLSSIFLLPLTNQQLSSFTPVIYNTAPSNSAHVCQVLTHCSLSTSTSAVYVTSKMCQLPEIISTVPCTRNHHPTRYDQHQSSSTPTALFNISVSSSSTGQQETTASGNRSESTQNFVQSNVTASSPSLPLDLLCKKSDQRSESLSFIPPAQLRRPPKRNQVPDDSMSPPQKKMYTPDKVIQLLAASERFRQLTGPFTQDNHSKNNNNNNNNNNNSNSSTGIDNNGHNHDDNCTNRSSSTDLLSQLSSTTVDGKAVIFDTNNQWLTNSKNIRGYTGDSLMNSDQRNLNDNSTDNFENTLLTPIIPLSAMAISAIALNVFKPIETWVSSDIDRIFDIGNELYNTSMAYRGNAQCSINDMGSEDDIYLSASEVCQINKPGDNVNNVFHMSIITMDTGENIEPMDCSEQSQSFSQQLDDSSAPSAQLSSNSDKGSNETTQSAPLLITSNHDVFQHSPSDLDLSSDDDSTDSNPEHQRKTSTTPADRNTKIIVNNAYVQDTLNQEFVDHRIASRNPQCRALNCYA